MSRIKDNHHHHIISCNNNSLEEKQQRRRQHWQRRNQKQQQLAHHASRISWMMMMMMMMLLLMMSIIVMTFSSSSSSSTRRPLFLFTVVNGFVAPAVGSHYSISSRQTSKQDHVFRRYVTVDPATPAPRRTSSSSSSSSSSWRRANKRVDYLHHHPPPPGGVAQRQQQQQQQQQQVQLRNHHHHHHKRTTTTSTASTAALLVRDAERIEQQVSTALESLRAMAADHISSQQQQDHHKKNTTTTNTVTNLVLFPTVRECNAALAAFGDDNDLLRALRLFGKMRKAAALQTQIFESSSLGRRGVWMPPIPCPTLVTYSTLMSRAVRASKPRVALRLWDLMKTSSSSSSSTSSSSTTTNTIITPDVKAANILMNCFAKLGDLDRARQLLEEMKQTTSTTSTTPTTTTTTTTMLTGSISSRNKSTKPSSSSSLLLLSSSSSVPVRPNLVTYNTFLNACQLAGDLDAALAAKEDLERAGIRPDATTYTTLIATVARNKKSSSLFGAKDPSLAFILLDEMKDKSRRRNEDGSDDDRLSPNGKTYSALIDACGRCGRSDLALQGLRIMLRQKSRQAKQFQKQQQQQQQQQQQHQHQEQFALQNEVGAWTAAINACGKADRLRTAMRLFYAMPKLGCEPNAVTCGCLTDSLLRTGHVDDALQVLRYMKQNGIVPSEVMYTSLMTRADRLVQMENKKQQPSSSSSFISSSTPLSSLWYQEDYSSKQQSTAAADTKAISVYTELMKSLMDGRLSSNGKSDNNNKTGKQQQQQKQQQLNEESAQTTDDESLLLKVFLVFQQMKASGAEADLTCYNALLRACARAGDLRRGLNVLQEMMQGGSSSAVNSNSYSAQSRGAGGAGRLQPNDRSWRELLRAARTGDQAVQVWKLGLGYHERQRQHQHGQSHSISDAFGSSFGRSGSSSSSDEKEAKWKPSAASFAALLAAHLQEADSFTSNNSTLVDNRQKRMLHARVVALYDGVLRGTNQKLGLDRMDVMEMLDDQRAMLLILRAIVSLDDLFLDDLEDTHRNNNNRGGTAVVNNEERRKLRSRATSILQLECFQEIMQSPQQRRRLRLASYRAVEKAQSWMTTTTTTTNVPQIERRDDFLPEWTDVL